MPKSLGTINRAIRFLGGIIILYAILGEVGSWSFILQAFGLYGIMSSLLGQCVICELIKEIGH